MHFKAIAVLTRLLALSQTIWTIQALAVRGSHTGQANSALIHHTKRGDPPLPKYEDFFTLSGDGAEGLMMTYRGWHREPPNSGWDPDAIAFFALKAWKYIHDLRPWEPQVVAALWIKGKGVALGTQVRGRSFSDLRATEARMNRLIESDAPVLWEHVQFREKKGTDTSTAKWHAEDTAMWLAAKEMKSTPTPIQGKKYPAGSLITIFGNYNKDDKEGWKRPCKSYDPEVNPESRLVPGCEEVLKDVGIDYYGPP